MNSVISIRIGIFAVICTLFTTSCSTECRHQRNQIAKGNRIIDQIEEYNKNFGTIPASLAELGLPDTMEGPIYFKRIGENHYILWFGLELGESCIYDSKEKKWE